jgi:hypothetical protein
MIKIAIVVFLFILPLFCFAQEVYIPKNLEECFSELKKVMTKKQLEEFKNKGESAIVEYHHGLGMWLRNNWGLWSGSRLKKYFNNLGIFHPDDMSSIILTSFHRYLNNKDIKLGEQIKYYKDYWNKLKKEGKEKHN